MSRTQIHITIGLLLLVHLSLAPLALPADRASPAFLVVLGALMAQPPLLAIWAVLASLALVRRFSQATMTGSTIGDETLHRLPALPNLTSLFLTATRIGDSGLRHLGKFNKLREIDLRLTDISDAGLAVLVKLNAQAGIDMGNTRVTSRGIARLRQIRPDLRVNATTDDASLDRFSSLFRPHLTPLSQPAGWRPVVVRMHAIGSRVTDRGVAALRGMTNIEELDLEGARLTDWAVNDLATLSGLKKLVLKDTQVSDSGVARLRQALPNCTISH